MFITPNKLSQLSVVFIAIIILSVSSVFPKAKSNPYHSSSIDVAAFYDSAHHWYDISDHEGIIQPEIGQKKYKKTQIKKIADNILLFQKTNGGWPKNYDMLAVLTNKQKQIILKSKYDTTVTTFDNEATHSHVDYLAKAYTVTKDSRYREGCLKGIEFILSAQYSNGGWPQYFPDSTGYRKYITFNDNAMTGIMNVFLNIIQKNPAWAFIETSLKEKIHTAFNKGIQCILNCQIIENGSPNVWCQQHDNITFQPRDARKFEPAAICNSESSDIVMLLMNINNPGKDVIIAIQNAVKWFDQSKILGTRVKVINAPYIKYYYHSTSKDKIIIKDTKAPPIWTRYYDLGSHRPLFCNRDSKPVYSFSEVDRERRTGYRWYVYDPQKIIDKYPGWQKKNAPDQNVLKSL
jgi:PelA/Pel-15E family pectate lyase